MYLVEAVKRLGELWLGARLEMILQSDLPLRPIVTVWIGQVNGIAELIGKQNDELNTSLWVVVNFLTGDGNRKGYDLRKAIDRSSPQWIRAKCGIVLLGWPRTQGRLKVVQINLDHCEAASHNLLITLRRLEIDIALIQKP